MFGMDYDEKNDPAKKLDSPFLKDQLESSEQENRHVPDVVRAAQAGPRAWCQTGVPESEPKSGSLRRGSPFWCLRTARRLGRQKGGAQERHGDRHDPLGKMDDLLESEVNELIRQAKTHSIPRHSGT